MKSAKTICQERSNIAYRSIDRMKPLYKNCIRLNSRNRDAHEVMKYHICRFLNKNDIEFLTECVLENGRRADILVPAELKIIEILDTETTEKFKEKIKEYPVGFTIIAVRADQEFNEKLIY